MIFFFFLLHVLFTFQQIVLKTRTSNQKYSSFIESLNQRRDLLELETDPIIHVVSLHPDLSSPKRQEFMRQFIHNTDKNGINDDVDDQSRKVLPGVINRNTFFLRLSQIDLLSGKVDLSKFVDCITEYEESDKTLLNIKSNKTAITGPFKTVHLVVHVLTPVNANDVEEMLSGLNLKSVAIHVNDRIGGYRFKIAVGNEEVGEVLDVVKKNENVIWIGRSLPELRKPLNNGVNTILQGLDEDENFRLWEMGLTGEDQVVAVMDTGVDLKSCFFYDENYDDVQVNTKYSNHRKIVYYEQISESGCYSSICDGNGHGTHVAGTIAGNVETTSPIENILDVADGIAKNAKLYVQAVGDFTTGGLDIPDFLDTILAKPFDNDARIHSNSWGCSISSVFSCTYDCRCMWAIDYKDYKQNDQASNFFCIQEFGVECCRVCSTYSYDSYYFDEFSFANPSMLFVVAAGNDGDISYDGTVSSPATGKNVLTVGASQTTYDNFLFAIKYMNLTDDEVSIYESIIQSNREYYDESNMADFSSRGPTSWGSLKPDVVAPGEYVVSMKSQVKVQEEQETHCSDDIEDEVFTLKGTSMATPAISGLTALVREYFTKGYYPTKEENLENRMYITGYFMKNILVHSAQKMTGLTWLGDNSRINLEDLSYPNNFYGFGKPDMYQLLFEEDYLYLYDKIIVREDSNYEICFKVSDTIDSSELIISMSYFDHPGVVYCTSDCMMDIMYLEVEIGKDQAEQVYYGNMGEEGDLYNNIEKIIISTDNLDKNTYINVKIVAPTLVSSYQEASLVISGIPLTSQEVCFNDDTDDDIDDDTDDTDDDTDDDEDDDEKDENPTSLQGLEIMGIATGSVAVFVLVVVFVVFFVVLVYSFIQLRLSKKHYEEMKKKKLPKGPLTVAERLRRRFNLKDM